MGRREEEYVTNPEHFALVVIGAGSAGKYVAQDAAESGWRVALVESGRVGGECPYVSCMPSKALLREARERRSGNRPGSGTRAWAQAIAHRDAVASGRDDGSAAAAVTASGVQIIRGYGRLVGPRRVRVTLADGAVRDLTADHLLISTGSKPVVPSVDGLDDVEVWTSDRLLSDDVLPASLLILGAGAVGCELAQVYSAYGTDVTLVESADAVLPQEDPIVSHALQQVLDAGGVRVVLGAEAVHAATVSGGVELRLADGRQIQADRLLAAVGRRPNVRGLGLHHLGLRDDEAIPVDARNRVRGAENVYAAGDVVDIGAFTHVADYHARIVLAELGVSGRRRDRDDRAIPRVVYTEPPLAAVGLTARSARDQHIDIVSHVGQIDETARAAAEGDGPLGKAGAHGGLVIVHADRRTGELVGAAAIGPGADSWLGEIAVAIRARIPVTTLMDVVHAFPTWSEVLSGAYAALGEELA
jgi:pyruvate/2-oxoglutarate dehydrogenase complex dihydrolipoamide dehydrogenase (E3) component